MPEEYTPGHTANAVDFMARRTLASHGAFAQPYLSGRQAILDLGCGPGTITCDLAEAAAGATVVGVDAGESPLERGREEAERRRLGQVRFEQASAYELPFADHSFDLVFSHALFEHLAQPAEALAEVFRVLRPGGVAALCSPDWGGFLLAPPSEELAAAVRAYEGLQGANGGDIHAGRKLGGWLHEAGFHSVKAGARYEVYESSAVIADYLALQLEARGLSDEAGILRQWSAIPHSMFAQAWASAVGFKP